MPGVLQSMGLQRVGHDLETEQQQQSIQNLTPYENQVFLCFTKGKHIWINEIEYFKKIMLSIGLSSYEILNKLTIDHFICI